jgi:hypothetical protein
MRIARRSGSRAQDAAVGYDCRTVPLGLSPAAALTTQGRPTSPALPRPLPAARARDTATSRFRRYLAGFALAVPPLLVYLIRHRPDTITQGQALLAAGVVLLGFAPALAYLARGARSPLPLLPLSGIFYAVTFGLPAFSEDLEWRSVPSEAVTRAFVLTVCGLLVMYASYVLSGRLFFRRLRPIRLPGTLTPSRLRAVAWAAFAAHLLHRFTPALQEVPSIGHFFHALGWLGMGLLYLSYLQGRLPALHALVFFGLALPLEVLGRFTSGALGEFFIMVVFLSLIYWQVRRRIPWAVLAASAVLFVLLNDVKQEYRGRVNRSGLETTDVWGKMATLADLFEERYVDFERAQPGDVTISSVNRIGHIVLLAYVVETTPSMVPYWGGQTYAFLFASAIPRFVWPEKPMASFGHEFGLRYLLLHSRNVDTTINVPWLVEFYMNFGVTGVIVGMALVGVVFRFLIQKLSHPTSSPAEYVLGLCLVFQLFNAEPSLAVMWGGLLLTFVSLYATLALASLRLRG